MRYKSAKPRNAIVDEPLRLTLSKHERRYIERRILAAKRQLIWSFVLPVVYGGCFAIGLAIGDQLGIREWIGVAFGLLFFVMFGICFHLFLAGLVDLIRFTNYRRKHIEFLKRYGRA